MIYNSRCINIYVRKEKSYLVLPIVMNNLQATIIFITFSRKTFIKKVYKKRERIVELTMKYVQLSQILDFGNRDISSILQNELQ